MFSAMTFVRGQEEKFVSRIALIDLPEAHEALRDRLAEEEQVEVSEAPGREVVTPSSSSLAINVAAFMGAPLSECRTSSKRPLAVCARSPRVFSKSAVA